MPTKPFPVPSVGRDVHYVSYGTPGGEYQAQHRAAKITEVETPGDPFSRVRLFIMNPTGLFFGAPAEGDGWLSLDFSMTSGTWHWPEFVPSVELEVDLAGNPIRT